VELGYSSSEVSPASRSSAASNSLLQMTICRSCGGNSAASSETSVVSDEPSGVRVKLKKGTLVMASLLDCVLGWRSSMKGGDSGSFLSEMGERGGRGTMRCLEAEEALVERLVRSEWEREAVEVTSEEVELLPAGE